ncbi:hypothetical protein KKG31_02800 [Patescibacteria group bacterium]|nr:hypothetical protein [Patescibacteria group bacterium]MBU1758090.1 hypothetical protein [Patescibacteria group bacterium]
MQFDKVTFDGYAPDALFLTDRDKKDILWGLEYGMNMVVASMVKTPENIDEMRQFLDTQNVGKMKVLAKIETPEALKNIDALIESADGIILMFDKISEQMKAKRIDERDLIQKCKVAGKPVIVTFV